MSYTEYWVRKIANQQITNQILAEKARSDVREIVDILVNNFHAQQIIGVVGKRKTQRLGSLRYKRLVGF
jgi:hypothetical protein